MCKHACLGEAESDFFLLVVEEAGNLTLNNSVVDPAFMGRDREKHKPKPRKILRKGHGSTPNYDMLHFKIFSFLFTQTILLHLNRSHLSSVYYGHPTKWFFSYCCVNLFSSKGKRHMIKKHIEGPCS